MSEEYMQQYENEREDHPEDGEYHFSDEGGYEPSPEEEEGKSPAITEKGGIAAHFTSFRRFVIIGGVFAGVLLVAYLVVAPPAVMAPTEITEAANTPTTPATPAAAPAAVEAANVPPKTEVVATAAPVLTPTPVAAPTPTPVAMSSPPPTATTLPTTPPPLAQSVPLLAAEAPTATPEAQIAATNKLVVERLKALEQENNKMIEQMHTEYSHKLVEFETQDKVLEEQMRALNARLLGMETQINQLLQVVTKQQQQQQPVPSPASAPAPINEVSNNVNESSATMALPSGLGEASAKSGYSVQAIIPGRAWLRAENGETVTVAEGDVLKSIGRVTKIDPYDGTIQIDTGNKVITLTYGNGDYA